MSYLEYISNDKDASLKHKGDAFNINNVKQRMEQK
jgi:hypothetical protein